MKKIFAASLIGLAALAGPVSALHASPLSALANHFSPGGGKGDKNIVLAQSDDSLMRIGQLEEQIRSLNGRIEEMSFQLLQMQEQLRKTQEDNEYRFQDLESGKGTGKSGALQKPLGQDGQNSQTAANQLPADTSAAGTSDTAAADNVGKQETTLGSIRFDEKGNQIGADMNESASIGSGAAPDLDASLPSASGTAASGLDRPDDIYNAAYGHVLQGDYQEAENGFRDYLDIFPEGDKAADASFWLGEAQYSQGNFNDAAKTFLNAHQTYGKSKKAPEMLLKLGMSLAALDNRDTACATLREVGKRYPNASKAVKAKVSSEQSRLAC
ncbi:tol-pal system protein YbgF [Mycoplana rhizolycopersici]|jgi:tol-pal system protein YbgF|uniref:Cell division coordinator CpoB n=1 Tax=Mycoplana rhizolycopersici TaxID=2746702 RepID=A0ABX2QD01_9HYPH|nr:tol-pal system protein YbgF [Rhizobium rhizolycopersici]NVP55614.1 tol-pal system protein YbgF [Rhizobium rhizolycopersici]